MISVCMATYNGERFIRGQIESILCQLNIDDELIISDDGSTDSTIEIISSFQDKRIKLYHHQKKQPRKRMAASFLLVADNFEYAINKARGEIIYLADQDDIWHPDRIEKTRYFFKDYDLVMCNYNVINGENEIIYNKFYSKSPVSKYLLKNIVRTPFLGCCMAFKRNVLEYCMPFPKTCIGHDYWLGCLIVHLGTFKYIEDTLHYYRKHLTNVSPATGKSNNPFWFKIIYRIQFMSNIMLYSIKYKFNKR
ncbi:putative glycosyltransferase EpsE [termite gut metagenome]|uniref:Putative glycosyltransferase EpsE n=1 Tax=termite gut metagenome TaxID=433724 RepID=A0A5J4SWC3_9ZZZZ